MRFRVLDHGVRPSSTAKSRAYLLTGNWDDWFTYSTLYSLVYFDGGGKRHDIGGVKIGQFEMEEGQRRPKLPKEFDSLDESFFSLGQDTNYDESLNDLGPELRSETLLSLRDMAFDVDLFKRARKEHVSRISIFRSVNPTTVQGQFRRIALGGARLTEYNFTYTAPKRKDAGVPPVELSFHVEPESHPPTNIHVLIGRNGVGKTHLLNVMTRALVGSEDESRLSGQFSTEDDLPDTELFANLVSVTFSAFDPFLPLPERRDRTAGIRYSYVGLKRSTDAGKFAGRPKSTNMLGTEFVRSVRPCLQGARLERWRRALETLEADPIFADAEVASLASLGEVDEDEFGKLAFKLFDKFSSGHKIVLLTITRLVETVEERTLALLDEPEAHLHPPLLAAFIRALSDLLVDRNGVAVIATHSPVILQEVPTACVWKLRRSGYAVHAERPEIETFGENVGVLTREVFGLEVTHSGFVTVYRHTPDRRHFTRRAFSLHLLRSPSWRRIATKTTGSRPLSTPFRPLSTA